MENRDKQIAALIRREIAATKANRERFGYPHHSVEDALLDGKLTGLRLALSLVDPEPWRDLV